MPSPSAAELLRKARDEAGVSQRELARRAETSQSVVARIEGGLTSPSWETLSRLLSAAGFELRLNLEPRPIPDSHMLDDVPRILRMTPEQRLAAVRNVSRFIAAARRV